MSTDERLSASLVCTELNVEDSGLKRKRIFIVEDEQIMSDSLEDSLLSSGYLVCGKAATGEEAVGRILVSAPDLVLMDLKLGGTIDGIQAARQLADLCSVPVVFLTANADLVSQQRILDANSFGYILKPFDERELHMAIEIAFYRCGTELKLKKLNEELVAALSHIKTLSGLLPICSWCKKVRNDTGYWEELETYVSTYSNAHLTHSICPECSTRVVLPLEPCQKMDLSPACNCVAENPPLKILMLEDDVQSARENEILITAHWPACIVERVQTRVDFMRALERKECDLILAEFDVPGFTGQDALGLARFMTPSIPFIFVAGAIGEDAAVETLKNGAADYILKTRRQRLIPAIERVLCATKSK